MKQLREAREQPTVGRLEFIRATDFRQRVTEASAEQWVVVTLYKEKYVACPRFNPQLWKPRGVIKRG